MNYLAPFTSSPGDFVTENTIDSHSIFMLDDAFKAVDSTADGWATLKRPDVPGTRDCNYCGVETARRSAPCHICDGVGTVSCSFMFDTHPDPLVSSTIEAINEKLDSGHSGSSYGWTMRNMESIAKKGWEVFMLNWRLSHLTKAIGNLDLTLEEQRNLYAIKFKLERMILDAEAKQKNPVAVAVANPVANVLQQARTVDNFLNTQAARTAAPDPLAFANAIRNDPGMRAMIPDIDRQADAMSRFAQGKMSYAEMRSLCG
jgi:hypothetical protein